MATSGSGFGNENYQNIPMAHPVNLENIKDVISHNKEYFKANGIHVNGSDYDLESQKYHCKYQHNYYQITNGVNYQHVIGGKNNDEELFSRGSSYSDWGGANSQHEITMYCGESKDTSDSETRDDTFFEEMNYKELEDEMNAQELANMSEEEREKYLEHENRKNLVYKLILIILLCLTIYGIVRVIIFVFGLL